MSRDFDLVPIIGPNSLSDSNYQTLINLNQSHNIIEDRFSGEYSGEQFQQQNINKLRDQKLRCYLCETPKQEYSLIKACGEFVCRGCFNYEGKDRVEQLIENARQLKFAHLIHSSSSSSSNNGNHNNDNSNSQVLKPTTIIESGNPPLLRPPLNKQPKLSPPNSNRSYNSLNNNTTVNIVSTVNNKGLNNNKEPQQIRSSSSSSSLSKEKAIEEQLNKIDNSLSGQKRPIWHQTEAQQVSSIRPISSETTSTVAKVSLPSIKQSPKTVLSPLNDDLITNNQVETKGSSSLSSSTTLLNQQSVNYKQKDNGNLIEPKLLSNTTIAQNSSLSCQSSSDILNQLDYKIINEEEQEMNDNNLSLQQIEQIQQQNRFQFDSNNHLTYPLLFQTQKNLTLGSSQGNIQDHSYHPHNHPSLFRNPTNMALQAGPNTTTLYHQAPPQDHLLARMSVVGGPNKRGRSTLIGNQCNQLNGQNLSFGSYSIMPSNILYQAGANLQGLYGSPGSIYATYHSPYQQRQQQQQQQVLHPLSPSSQSSHHGQHHKSPSLLASPTFSFSNNSSSNSSSLGNNYTSLLQHPKGAQVILDPRLRNLSYSSQEQRESLNNNQQTTKTNSLELQLLDSNNMLPTEQQSNNKIRRRHHHQNSASKEQTTFEQNVSPPVTSPTNKSSIRDQNNINGSLSSIDHIFMGSQSSLQQNSIQPKQISQIPLNSQRSSLVKSVHMYHNNSVPTSSSSNDAKQQQQSYPRESRKIDVGGFDLQKPVKVASKIGASPDKNSSKHHNIEDELDKQKEVPSRSASLTKESASILRQKLSDQRLNKASSSNNIIEQIEDTIVIDVEEETDTDIDIDVDKTNNITASASSSRRTVSDTNNNNDNDNNNQFSSFKQPSLRLQQSLNSQSSDSINQAPTEDRLISKQTTSNSTSIPQNVDNVYPGSSKSSANFSPENDSNNNEQAPSCNNILGLKLNCLICSKNLVDRHFVQCPSVLSHKFCFSCTRNSISDQRDKYKVRVGEEEKIYCLSGKMCPLIDQKEPWTFMTSEVETIFREKNKRSNSPHDLVKKSSSSSPSLSNQQKFKRKPKLNNDERIKKRVLMEPSNRKPSSRPPKSFDPDKHD